MREHITSGDLNWLVWEKRAKDGTPGCTREAVEFRDMVKEFEKEDIVTLGVSKDSVQNIRTQSRARLQRRDFFSTSIGRRSNPNPPTLQLFSARWLLQKSVLIRFA